MRVWLALLCLVAPACRSSLPDRPAPPRSLEAARLSMLVGRWQAEYKAVMDGTEEVVHGKAEVDARWHSGSQSVMANNRVQLKYEEGVTAELTSLSIFVWDAAQETYRSWTIHPSGEVGEGTLIFDGKTRTWIMTERSVDAQTGALSESEGFMRYISNDEKLTGWTFRPASGEGGFTSRGHSKRVAKN